MDKRRVLVGSLVYQKPKILEAFLMSLKNLITNTILSDYMFFVDSDLRPKKYEEVLNDKEME